MPASWDRSVGEIRGVGAARAAQLEKLGIRTLGDLVRHFPRQYRDLRQVQPLTSLKQGEMSVVSVLVGVGGTEIKRNGLSVVRIPISDHSGNGIAVFFNQPYIRHTLRVGEYYLMWGKADRHSAGPVQITSPQYLPMPEDEELGFLPAYPATSGISQKAIAKLVKLALEMLDPITDPLPAALRENQKLATLQFAFWNVHFPKEEQALQWARERLIFEELFFYQLALRMAYRQRSDMEALPLPLARDAVEPLVARLPYKLTGAQQRVWEEMADDMARDKPMNRLVQGDVGSGKTILAAMALLAVAKAGAQGAMMAPTEILAMQHYQSLSELLEPLGVRVGLLTGSLKAGESRRAKESIAMGYWQVVVGTHALIQKSVTFHELALIVADEQHRFGVMQRAALGDKAAAPHRLVMSATPIPRTVGLTLFGDLSFSVLDELPPGRKPVMTRLVPAGKEDSMLAFLRKELDAGRQAYMVCPLVEEGELPVHSVQTLVKELEHGPLEGVSMSALHGKMKGADKERILNAFQRRELQLLVSTTVVEVGVNVPNASVMVIWDAERFGLSQLHQLRGRVGRGADESFCFLRAGDIEGDTRERLQAFCSTNDGFAIAEMDIALRGIGDFLGQRQHGIPELRLAAAVLLSAAQGKVREDMRIVEQARTAAQQAMENQPHSDLLEEAVRRHPQLLDDPERWREMLN